jgi:hypothetical protein
MNEIARKTSAVPKCRLLAVLALVTMAHAPAARAAATAVRPGVEVSRWGRQLAIEYRAARPGSTMRLPPQKETPPQFSVYRDGQEIASGSFRYG